MLQTGASIKGTIYVSRSKQFKRAKLKEKCELQGKDIVQGQISKHIFTLSEHIFTVFDGLLDGLHKKAHTRTLYVDLRKSGRPVLEITSLPWSEHIKAYNVTIAGNIP